MYKQSFLGTAVAMIDLKGSSRRLHIILEGKKKIADEEKLKVDDLQLKLQNLLYKQAYLEREIKTCQSLPTPSLNALEQELQTSLKANGYSNDLIKIHDDIVDKLYDEKLLRISTQSTLEQAKSRLQCSEEVFEKKRKCIEVDLPAKVMAVENATSDISLIFKQLQAIEAKAVEDLGIIPVMPEVRDSNSSSSKVSSQLI